MLPPSINHLKPSFITPAFVLVCFFVCSVFPFINYMYVHACVCMCMCVSVCMHACVSVCVCVCACMHLGLCVYLSLIMCYLPSQGSMFGTERRDCLGSISRDARYASSSGISRFGSSK